MVNIQMEIRINLLLAWFHFQLLFFCHQHEHQNGAAVRGVWELTKEWSLHEYHLSKTNLSLFYANDTLCMVNFNLSCPFMYVFNWAENYSPFLSPHLVWLTAKMCLGDILNESVWCKQMLKYILELIRSFFFFL